ncbi:MAG TPA: aminotransferase class III-fold pyridoxal phosphate-dependent enzyme [Polyangiales bacterium]|nr:aminotransferase class III-fold pyridoxal phosphate-dependent enzyme [Polyangiales bacterium]
MSETGSSPLMQFSNKPKAVMVSGRGSWLWDEQGRSYLDFVQGWAVNSLGHSPGVVQRALQEQAALLINASPGYHNMPSHRFARELTKAAGMDRAFLCSTGAEANEGAIKLARKWGGLHKNGAFEIITLQGSFHGRTLATMAASAKPNFAERFPPITPGFVHVPHGDLAAIEKAITPRTVAVMLEPIQGEAGVVTLPAGFLRALRELTTSHNMLLIADEIQTGMGRTGRLFACEHESVTPDIMTVAKGIGAGVPLAALLARAAVSCFAAGDQGGTYTAHPLMCAVGSAVLHTIDQPAFLEHVTRMGAHLRKGLGELSQRYSLGSVSGAGLLLALSMPQPIAAEVTDAAFDRGLLINAARPDRLRFMPALNITLDEIDRMLTVLDSALGCTLRK